MLPVLDLYPYFSKQSQHFLFDTFFNENIYLSEIENKYYLDNKITNHTKYYFGKFSNPNNAYKVYRHIIIVMSLLGEFKLNKKYLNIDIKELKFIDRYFVDKYKPYVDDSNFSTICITFDGTKYYVEEFCNFNKTSLKTIYESINLINVKNHFLNKLWSGKDFEYYFWLKYNQKEDIIDIAVLWEAIENNTGWTTLEEINKLRSSQN